MCEPATGAPFEGVGAPGLRVRVEGLRVDYYGCLRGEDVRFVA